MRADALGLFWQEMPKIKEAKVEEKYLPPNIDWNDANYLPYYQQALAFPVPRMEDMDVLMAQQKKDIFFYDIECYVNYFLVAFRSQATGKVIYFEKFGDSPWSDDPRKLKWIFENIVVVGFNNKNYDDPMCAAALQDFATQTLKMMSNQIIQTNLKPWMFYRQHGLEALNMNSIDIMDVAPLTGSLKAYAGRGGAPKMQDLPYHHEAVLSPQQITVVRWYCVNDLDNTKFLFNKLPEEMELRVQMSAEYGVDLRSKSDAQIAEAVISHEIEKLTGSKPRKPKIDPGTTFNYIVPSYLDYRTPLMRELLDIVRNSRFTVDEDGSIALPPTLSNLKVSIGDSVYKLGIGGLHSTEKKQCVFATENMVLEDVDVESFYPRIILNLGLFPQHLGRWFLKVFDKIVVTRLDAKHRKDKKKANSLKIVINGTFGKLGSKYSIFYSPDLLIQVTLTGQLSLLLLIEMLELAGIKVVSANTDGIVLHYHKSQTDVRNHILQDWQHRTRFVLEATPYQMVCSKDVNNYIAIKQPDKDGVVEAKRKGLYAKASLSKNPTTTICTEAVVKYLIDRTPIEKTIHECQDIQQFVSVRKVNGGAVHVVYNDFGETAVAENMEIQLQATGWAQVQDQHPQQGQRAARWLHPQGVGGTTPQGLQQAYAVARWQPVAAEYLGAMIRWYYSKLPDFQTQRILYAGANNKVPKSDGAKPIMEFDGTLPNDIDYDWYIKESKRILRDLGYE